MGIKLVVAAAILLVSIPSLAQVEPQATAGRKFPVNWSVGGGMDYFSGDWGTGDINRWGPSVWATSRFWHCLGTNVEGHSMIIGGNQLASKYKLFVGEGGAMCTMGYWAGFSLFLKAKLASQACRNPATVQVTFIPHTAPGLSEAARNTIRPDTGGRAWTIPTKPSRVFTAASPTRTTL